MLSPMQKDYLLQTVLAGNVLMTKIVKEFAIPDPSAILPEPAGIEVESQELHQQVLHKKAQEIAQRIMQSQGGGQQPPPPQAPQLTNGQAPPEAPPVQ